MTYEEHPKGSGALFTNTDKRTEQQPDFRGNIELTADQIRRLIDMAKKGLEPKLQVAGWWRQAKSSGQTYMSLSTEAYMKSEEQPQYPPQQTGLPPGVPQQGYPQPVPQPGYQQQPGQMAPPGPVPVPQPVPQQVAQPAADQFMDEDIPF